MAPAERHRQGFTQSSTFYPPQAVGPQAIWSPQSEAVGHSTALDRFEEQWQSTQGRVIPDESTMSPLRPAFEKIRSPTASPPPPPANAPFYVPRRHEPSAYQQRDRQDMILSPGPAPREYTYVQVNQAPRPANLRAPLPPSPPWQRNSDMERQSDHPRSPLSPHQFSHERLQLQRPATVPPQQYRQQPHPRHSRPESHSRRHNPYANSDSRRRRRSSSSQARQSQKRRFTPPQHHQRQFPNRPSVL